MFVTNSLSLLPYCDQIIVLENGMIEQMGSYNKLCKDKIKSSIQGDSEKLINNPNNGSNF